MRVLCLLLLAVCVAGEDYYKVLGVARGASEEGIKAVYKKLAREWHPDLHDDKEKATEMMKMINEAKDTLMDPEKRRKYDAMTQRMTSVSSSLSGIGDIPPIVLVYLTCPVYFSFRLNTFFASLLCTTMLLSHLVGVVACYLFYKYALWGPIPVHRRSLYITLSIPIRFLMFFFILGFSGLFMISLTEYAPWIGAWVVAPCICMWIIDVTLCVETTKERKPCGPAGAPKTVHKQQHKRPAWLPFWMSFNDLTEHLSKVIHELDNDPVVQVEYTRTTEIEKRYRKCDLERVQDAQDILEEEKKKLKDIEAKKRNEQEEVRRMQAERITKNAKKSTIKAVEQVKKTEPKEEVKPPAPTPTAPKKGEVPNVTSTGSAAWTPAQQKDFERALRKYPAGTRNRWEAVAELVPGKSDKQCAQRFKELASLRSVLGTTK